jgi:hypothetical protein
VGIITHEMEIKSTFFVFENHKNFKRIFLPEGTIIIIIYILACQLINLLASNLRLIPNNSYAYTLKTLFIGGPRGPFKTNSIEVLGEGHSKPIQLKSMVRIKALVHFTNRVVVGIGLDKCTQ